MPARPPPSEEGGDPPCWAHLFSDEGVDDATLATFVRRAADAVVISDRDGRITFWNEAAERVFGWPATIACGQSLDLIIPERQRARHWDGFHQAVARGTTRYGDQLLQVPAVHRDGGIISIAFTVTLLIDGEERLDGIVAVIRDETDARRQRLELERKVASQSG